MALSRHILTYSHGGSSEGATTAVVGTATGAGRTIEITHAGDCVPLIFKNIGTQDVVIRFEFNGTVADATTFQPDPTMWINASTGGNITVAAGGGDAYSLRTQIPYWRTYIVSLTPGGNLVSFVGYMYGRTRQWQRAKYPDASSIQTEF